MAGLDLEKIHEALADQIRANIGDGYTVRPFPMSGASDPRIEIWPGTPYVEPWVSHSATGIANVNVEIRIFNAAANSETAWRRMAKVLSTGDGFSDSILAAVRVDKTLGGLVEDAFPQDADWDATEDNVLEGRMPVQIIVRKIGGPT